MCVWIYFIPPCPFLWQISQHDLLQVVLCLQQGIALVSLVVFVSMWDAALRFYWYLCESIRTTYTLLVTSSINGSGFIRNLSWLRPWGHLGPSECSMLIKSWLCIKISIFQHFCFKMLVCYLFKCPYLIIGPKHLFFTEFSSFSGQHYSNIVSSCKNVGLSLMQFRTLSPLFT